MHDPGDPAFWWRLAAATATIVAGLCALGWTARRYGFCTASAGASVRRTAMLALGSGAAVHVLQVGGETIVVGSGGSGVTLICRLEAPPSKGPPPFE